MQLTLLPMYATVGCADNDEGAVMVGELFGKLTSAVRPGRTRRVANGPSELMPGQKLGYLSALEVFQDLSQAEMQWLDRTTTSITCEKGRVIYRPGEAGEVLYLLKKGAVDLYRLSSEGKKLVIAHLAEQTFFGEMSILGHKMYDTFAEASQASILCAMSRTDVEQLLLTKPVVALRILNVIGRRLVDIEQVLEDLAFRDVRSRIASVLLRLSDQQGGPTVSGMTHQELAEMAGTFRETATQALNQLRSDGLIAIGRTRIEILDAEGLARAAHRD